MRILVLSFSFSMIVFFACDKQEGGSGLPIPHKDFVSEPRIGHNLYRKHCQHCHGLDAKGSQQGPPLAHKIYEPSHHADLSFYMAVANGVRAHHWQFGDMPKIPSVEPQQAGHIIAYVRELQRKAGIK